MFNRKTDGSEWTHDEKSEIWWNTTKSSPNVTADKDNVQRLDKYGNLLHWSEYGNTASKYGWEIDHKVAKVKGGLSVLSNLQALQWDANRTKSDDSEGIALTAKLKNKGL